MIIGYTENIPGTISGDSSGLYIDQTIPVSFSYLFTCLSIIIPTLSGARPVI